MAKDKKKDNKKLLVLVLLLFAVVGITGYAAYSYFSTTGSVSGSSNNVSIASFNPQTIINGNSDFLGNGGTLTITCPDSTTGNESNLECTGSITVSNDGGTDIDVEILNATATATNETGMSIYPSTPTFSWDDNETSIEAGQTATLDITVPVSVSSDFGSSSEVERNSPYEGGSAEVEVSFRLKATQSRD